MRLSEQLHQEIVSAKRVGVYASNYYRFLGYAEDFTVPTPLLRANGVYSLFDRVAPYIYAHDRIAGCHWGAVTDAVEPFAMDFANNVVNKIGMRTFQTNVDHYTADFPHLLRSGVRGILSEIEASIETYRDDAEKTLTLQGMHRAMDGFLQMITHYAEAAENLKNDAAYDSEHLEFIARNCRALTQRAPETFAEALQLVWLCWTAYRLEGRMAMALGRLDQYLYPYYCHDIEKGILTDDEVLELLENVFIKIDDTVNIAVGGMNLDGGSDVNRLSYLTVLAVKNCNIPGPNLSARIAPNTPDDFLRECLISIGTGLGYPALMNDAVNIAALKRYGYADEDAYDYSMVGCIENFISGKQPPWSDGRFDSPKFLDYVFFRGVSRFNRSVGIDTGDLSEITSMDEFMRRFEIQLEQGADQYCAMFRGVNNGVNYAQLTDPFLSCLCFDCIGRGLDVNNGGALYPSVHGVGLMGIGTITDSLAALEKVVFVDKVATLGEVRDALAANFEGYALLRKRLLDAPKYGNDDEFADKYARWFVDFMCRCFSKHKTRDGGGIYTAIAANIQNISVGSVIGATPDGRLQGEPLSDAGSPTYGRDKNGPTATLNSVSKPDYTKVACGSVVNQKYDPSVFQGERLEKLLILVKTYFQQGGQELQINATSRQVLMDAMEHPEKYENLVVRVSGFSGYYVRQSKGVQLDILNRTQHQ